MFTYFFKDRTSNKTYFELMGEDSIRKLVENFYQIMETDPKAKKCLDLHNISDGKVHRGSKEKLALFLIGWLGGPNYFIDRFGPPRMRARHLHVKIDTEAKEQWMYCMDCALKSSPLTRKEKAKLRNSFLALAMRIQNV